MLSNLHRKDSLSYGSCQRVMDGGKLTLRKADVNYGSHYLGNLSHIYIIIQTFHLKSYAAAGNDLCYLLSDGTLTGTVILKLQIIYHLTCVLSCGIHSHTPRRYL